MTPERTMELLRNAVNHIESFEDKEGENVLKELGFSEDELAEIRFKIEFREEDKKNIAMVSGKLIHHGELLWELSDYGSEYIFSDQREDDSSPVGWVTENVPFKNYSHYFHISEKNGATLYTGYAWYDEKESYVQTFTALEDCLDWLVPEKEHKPPLDNLMGAVKRMLTEQENEDKMPQQSLNR